MPTVSVIILTCLIRTDQLKKCIRSIQRSSFQNIEIIVVINTTLKTKNISSTFFPSSVHVIRLPDNRGVYGYTVGVINAKGKYIFFLDDDCTLEKKSLEKIINYFDKSSPEVGIVSATVYDPVNKVYQYTIHHSQERDRMYTFAGGASIIKKEVFSRIGYYDHDFFLWLHEDDFGLRVKAAGYRIVHSPDIVVYHHNEKMRFRPKLAFTVFRNKAWLNVKHFSLFYLPLIILRDLVWIIMYPIRIHSFFAFFVALWGYLQGYGTSLHVLKKRQVLPNQLQWEYLMFYLNYRSGS